MQYHGTTCVLPPRRFGPRIQTLLQTNTSSKMYLTSDPTHTSDTIHSFSVLLCHPHHFCRGPDFLIADLDSRSIPVHSDVSLLAVEFATPSFATLATNFAVQGIMPGHWAKSPLIYKRLQPLLPVTGDQARSAVVKKKQEGCPFPYSARVLKRG